MVEKDDCAIILPIEDGRVWLVEQFRYTIQERALELPQGGWEMENVDPEELARGELKEETGLHAAEMTYLGFMWIAYGFSRQKQHVFLATGLTMKEREPDDEEHDLIIDTAISRGVRADDARRDHPRHVNPGRMGTVPYLEGSPSVRVGSTSPHSSFVYRIYPAAEVISASTLASSSRATRRATGSP